MLNELDIYEKSFLYSIAAYVGYEDGCLKYDNGKEINFESLIEITQISRRKLKDVINQLVNKKVLYKKKKGRNIQYFVNPWLISKGNRISKKLRTMFKEYNIKIYKKKWRELQ